LRDDWSGKFIVAGASCTRSQFNGDFAWSDYVMQKGYAYVSRNKGIYNLFVASLASPTPPEPLSCRLSRAAAEPVHSGWRPDCAKTGATGALRQLDRALTAPGDCDLLNPDQRPIQLH
jgi:hypothetical protein